MKKKNAPPTSLNKYQQGMIKNLAKTIPVATLAEMLDASFNLVERAVNKLYAAGKPTFQRMEQLKTTQRAALKGKHQRKRGLEAMNRKRPAIAQDPVLEAKKLEREKDKLKAEQHERKRRAGVKGREAKATFKTKVVDYSGLKMVRIDKRTVIYVKPGQKAAQAVSQYNSIHKKTTSHASIN